MEVLLHRSALRQASSLQEPYHALMRLKQDKHSMSKVLRTLVPLTSTGSLEEAGDLLEEMIDNGVVTIR